GARGGVAAVCGAHVGVVEFGRSAGKAGGVRAGLGPVAGVAVRAVAGLQGTRHAVQHVAAGADGKIVFVGYAVTIVIDPVTRGVGAGRGAGVAAVDDLT